MDKRSLIAALSARRDALDLSVAELGARSGLTDRSVRNALGPQGNPQLSSLLALVDALGLELQLVPKGFGAPLAADEGYRPVATRIGNALQPAFAMAPTPPRSPAPAPVAPPPEALDAPHAPDAPRHPRPRR